MTAKKWRAVVLAAGRGPRDPMAQAYGVEHKCAVQVGGKPMLTRVVETLLTCERIGPIVVSIEDKALATRILGKLADRVEFHAAKASAPLSAADAVTSFPSLVTTGDHPLLTVEMLDYFLARSEQARADLTAGVASAETILAAYPGAKRTFLKLGRDRVSGCNLYALQSANALKVLQFWHYLEAVRKKPWRLVLAFGPAALLRYLTGMLSLESSFAIASKRLGLTAAAILMPFADAAVDVDKPADKELAERILAERAVATSPPPSSAPAASRSENPPRTK